MSWDLPKLLPLNVKLTGEVDPNDLRICETDRCENEIYADGLCQMHYEQDNCWHLNTQKADFGERYCPDCDLTFGNS